MIAADKQRRWTAAATCLWAGSRSIYQLAQTSASAHPPHIQTNTRCFTVICPFNRSIPYRVAIPAVRKSMEIASGKSSHSWPTPLVPAYPGQGAVPAQRPWLLIGARDRKTRRLR